MMYKSLILITMLSFLILSASCTKAPASPPETSKQTAGNNSLNKNNPSQQSTKPTASPVQSRNTDSLPASVKSIKISEKNSFLSIEAEFENNSEKVIETIIFSAILFNNAGQPVNKYNDGNYGNVEEALLLQSAISPGTVASGSWRAYNYKSANKAKIVLQEVHFSDKTAWINQKYDSQLDKVRVSMN